MPDYTHLVVGDRVMLHRSYRGSGEAEVTKVGRVWLEVSRPEPSSIVESVRRTDGRGKDNHCSISTLAEHEERNRRGQAEKTLRTIGLIPMVSATHPRLSTDLIVELAAVVERHQSQEGYLGDRLDEFHHRERTHWTVKVSLPAGAAAGGAE